MADYVMNKDGKYGYLFCQDLSGLPATHAAPEAVEAVAEVAAEAEAAAPTLADKIASIKYHHEMNLEQFLLKR